jgi:hypothetical protein
MKREANISKCNQFRYTLSRVWDINKPKVMFMMLNPSKADAITDDPTIIRCIDFAKKWDFGGLYVCNLFACIATNPKDLFAKQNPLGNENDVFIKKYADEVDIIVCAWGNRSIIKSILKEQTPFELLDFVKDKLYYLKLTKDGTTPRHPLYLKADLTPIKYNL